VKQRWVSGCRETDAADVLTLQMRVGGIRLRPKAIRYDRGGIELWASEEGGDELENGSGCRKMDAADVLTLQMRVGGIRLCAQKPSDTIGGNRTPGK